MRRAQLSGQFIIYTIGLIVMFFVLVFGHSILIRMQEWNCEVSSNKFSSDLMEYVNRYRGIHTTKIVSLPAPCDVTDICFVDERITQAYRDDVIPNPQFTWLEEEPYTGVHEQVEGSVAAGAPTNVFMVDAQGFVTPIPSLASRSAPIYIRAGDTNEPRITCIERGRGVFRFRTEGIGRGVWISAS